MGKTCKKSSTPRQKCLSHLKCRHVQSKSPSPFLCSPSPLSSVSTSVYLRPRCLGAFWWAPAGRREGYEDYHRQEQGSRHHDKGDRRGHLAIFYSLYILQDRRENVPSSTRKGRGRGHRQGAGILETALFQNPGGKVMGKAIGGLRGDTLYSHVNGDDNGAH